MDNKYDDVMQGLQFRYMPDAVPIAEEAVTNFEREFGRRLPADYREFLLKYGFSAGRSYTRYGKLDQPNELDKDSDVGVFYGVGGPGSRTLSARYRVSRESGMPSHLLPIARSDAGQICLSMEGGSAGRVYLWADPKLELDEEILIAYSFDSFMRSLRSTE
jgi:hypothetical protein